MWPIWVSMEKAVQMQYSDKATKSIGPSCKKWEQELFDSRFSLVFCKNFFCIHENWWPHHKYGQNVTIIFLVALYFKFSFILQAICTHYTQKVIYSPEESVLNGIFFLFKKKLNIFKRNNVRKLIFFCKFNYVTSKRPETISGLGGGGIQNFPGFCIISSLLLSTAQCLQI